MHPAVKAILWVLGGSLVTAGLSIWQKEEEIAEAKQQYRDAVLNMHVISLKAFESNPALLDIYNRRASEGHINQADCHMPELLLEDVQNEKKILKASRERLSVYKIFSDKQLASFEEREETAYNAVNIKVDSIRIICSRLFAEPAQPEPEQDMPRDPLFLPQFVEPRYPERQEITLPYKLD